MDNPDLPLSADDTLPAEGRGGASGRLDLLLDVPLELTVELGRTRLTIENVLSLQSGSVIELDKIAGDPLDILLNGRLVARGEAVVVGEKFGIRVTSIVSPTERLARLN
jgi:flagellar motor switch protein FliN/FliY